MLLPIEWLKEFAQADNSPEELAEIYRNLGFTPEEVKDDVIDLEVTPNRGDTLSIYGLARELHAKQGTKIPQYCDDIAGAQPQSDIVSFSDSAKKTVPRFSYLIARGGKIQPSNDAMQRRLKAIGINPKNNIVDLTNYLMHECGQPLHAFDLDKIEKLHLDFAKDGDDINLLDGVALKAKPENLVAYSGSEIIDLVGISGCKNSAVSDDSNAILLQAAIFDPASIRRSSKSAHTQTPASYRYERGVDWQLPLKALQKAKQYLEKWGYKIEQVVDIVNKIDEPLAITFDPMIVNKIGGVDVETDTIDKYLDNLGFGHDGGEITVPSWRQNDIKNSAGLAREVLRLYGFNNVKPMALEPQKADRDDRIYESLRATLSNLGMTEVENYPFLNDKEVEALGADRNQLVELSNPLSENFRYLRPTLKAKMVQAISANPWYDQITMFEIGHVFGKDSEETHLAIITTNKKFGIKDIIGDIELETITPESKLGQLYKLRRNCYFVELIVNDIKLPDNNIKVTESSNLYKPISKYPPVVRDVSFLVDAQTDVIAAANDIAKTNDFILLVEPFDEYTDTKFNGKKSIALRITYQNLDRTLTPEEADDLFSATRTYIEDKYGSTIRQ